MDLSVVPTISFRLLYGSLILNPGRRQMLWLNVTAHPTAEWVAGQLTEACDWDRTPEYLVRDRGHAERLIGSLRRECLDHVVVFGERHLRQLLLLYMDYYNRARIHLSLNKDAPVPRAVQAVGRIYANPSLGGLHHHYVRI
jgi:transposase InsO family protein